MRKIYAHLVFPALSLVAFAAVAENEFAVSFEMKVRPPEFVVGEPVKGGVRIVNSSSVTLSVGEDQSKDDVILRLFRGDDEVPPRSKAPYVSSFALKPGGRPVLLETVLNSHFDLNIPGRYRVRPVLKHSGRDYLGSGCYFTVLMGDVRDDKIQEIPSTGLKRRLRLVTPPNRADELFLQRCETGVMTAEWKSYFVGRNLAKAPRLEFPQEGIVVVCYSSSANGLVTDYAKVFESTADSFREIGWRSRPGDGGALSFSSDAFRTRWLKWYPKERVLKSK